MSYLIVAPHPDDEIIGCHSYLREAKHNKTTVFFPKGLGDPGASQMAQYFGVKITDHVDIRHFDCVLAPDPYFEVHPDHRHWGFQAERWFREKSVSRVIFYVTRMNAPYIFEVKNPMKKADDLSNFYPHKRSLWQYDHRFFLFEGYCEWHRPD